MSLLERLEAKRRELDQVVVRSLNGSYDYRAADMRDLLGETIVTLGLRRVDYLYLEAIKNIGPDDHGPASDW